MRLVRSETSNVSTFFAPLSLLRIRFQVGSTPQPSGDTMPRPVTTTRLISGTPAHDSRPPPRDRTPSRPPAACLRTLSPTARRVFCPPPAIPDASPANDGKLRTANIQGFKFLQGVLCPSVGGSVIILPKP